MVINANTKIAAILKHKPEALEEIISINPKFEKLRNPIMRKLMAGRTSIGMAAKIAGCDVADFFQKLQPLGFEISTTKTSDTPVSKSLPSEIKHLKTEDISVLDVRPVLDAGEDPLNLIIQSVNQLPESKVLKIINTFEPTPLIKLLEKKGFSYYVDNISDNLIETYFFKNKNKQQLKNESLVAQTNDWNEIKSKFIDHLINIDVRQLQMPLPMHTILENLENLKPEEALYVYHKRIPVFLLPELRDRGFDYRISEISEGEVHLLIFHQ